MTEPHHPAVAAFVERLAAQPNLTSTTPGPECPECHMKFVVVYGRRSKKWLVLHGRNYHCPGYLKQYPHSDTQDEALAIAREAGK